MDKTKPSSFSLLTGMDRENDMNPTRTTHETDTAAIAAAREFVTNSDGADPWAFVIHATQKDRTFSISRKNGERLGLYYSFQKYRVTDCATIEEFLARYYKRDRYTGRGDEYAACLLKSHTADLEHYGFDFISHHDSITGEVVAFYPPDAQTA